MGVAKYAMDAYAMGSPLACSKDAGADSYYESRYCASGERDKEKI